MRALCREVNSTPKIFFLKFSSFLIFGAVAALERLLIEDGLYAFFSMALTYGGFILHEKYLPPHFLFYFLTKSSYFAWEKTDENPPH